MELRRLNYFLRIATEGSLGKASRSLGIAQPALGRHVQALETELGVSLFRRVPKGMELTEEGQYLKEHLIDPMELIQTALRNVRSFPGVLEASLSIGLPRRIAPLLGGRLAKRFQADLQNLQLRLVEGDSAKLAEGLARRTIDIALLAATAPVEEIYRYPVVSEPLFVVGPITSALAGRTSVKFHELSELPLIVPGAQSGLRILLEKQSLANDIELKIVLEVDSDEITKQAISMNIGYGIMPLSPIKAEVERGELFASRIDDPSLELVTNWAMRPRWPVSRQIYNVVERVIFEEWHAIVSSGQWPARWLFDMSTLGTAVTRTGQ